MWQKKRKPEWRTGFINPSETVDRRHSAEQKVTKCHVLREEIIEACERQRKRSEQKPKYPQEPKSASQGGVFDKR